MKIEDLTAAPVIPLVDSNDPAESILITKALVKGGLKFIEVVLRSDNALDCLEAIAKEFEGNEDAVIGAGTVLTVEDVDNVVARGAKYIVSPGLNADVVKRAQHHGVPILPGIMTASEVQNAWAMGLRAVKFFPAKLAGGSPMLKAMGSVFRGMRFVPTGGVSPANLNELLSIPAVIACGGTWLTPKAEIAAGNFDAITKIAEDALEIALAAKA